MKVLLLGGTGAMGIPLQKHLLRLGYDVHVTSRSEHENGSVIYHCGNAHDMGFLETLLKDEYDAIVDFMSYKTDEFKVRVSTLCSGTGHYIFLSSSRVYSPCDGLITEDHPRLLDVCKDEEYLRTDEYALTKARQEDALRKSGYMNWTIVRPSLTYNTDRLQYAIGEKEEWLYRYLNNEKIVFPQNMSSVVMTMSYGDDVAYAIALLVGNKNAMGEAVHIAGANPIMWKDVNRIYNNVLNELFHRDLDIYYIDDWAKIGRVLHRFYQIKYARSITRKFDSSKLKSIVGDVTFQRPEEGLKKCLNQFVENGMRFKHISWRAEAYFNRITKDNMNCSDFGKMEKIKYYIGRYTRILEL